MLRLGDPVHYWPTPDAAWRQKDKDTPLYGLVASVLGEDYVNLAVLDQHGEWFNVTSVPVYTGGKPMQKKPEWRYCYHAMSSPQ